MKTLKTKHGIEIDVLSIDTFTDNAEIIEFSSAHYSSGDYVEGFEVDIDLDAILPGGAHEGFTVVFQSADRSDKIRAHGLADMRFAKNYGADWDESGELEAFIGYEDWDEITEFLTGLAEDLCKKWYDDNKDERLNKSRGKKSKKESRTKASMQKKLESLRRGKKSEGAAREYTSRIDSLVAMEYLTMEDVAEFLLRAFSEDDIRQAYGWMEQDELIPSESQLADDGVKFNDEGDLVSLDSDESYRRTRRAHRRIHEQRARRAKKAMGFKNNSGTIEILIGSNMTGENTHEENLLFINALRSALEDEYSNANISVEMSRNISSTVLASGFDDIDDVEANVNLIKNRVWDKMEY